MQTEQKNVEQAEQATGLREIIMENITHRRRRSIGDTMATLDSLVDVAIFLDKAEEDSIDMYGGSGTGAGAFVEAVFNGDDPDDEGSGAEDVSTIDDPMFSHLPFGDRSALRSFLSRQRRNTCWNGNNHVPAPTYNCETLLQR